MLRHTIAIALLLVATDVLAGPLVITVDDANGTQKSKFIPLDSARPQAGKAAKPLALTKEKAPMLPLRSDKQALAAGQMRIDRQLTHPLGPQPSMLITPTQPAQELQSEVMPPTATPAATATLEANPGALETDSEEIEGNSDGVNPVLSLFGAGDNTPSSFRDAMAGRSTASVAGIGHQPIWPVSLAAKQYLTSGYGMRADPFTGRPSFHGGIDIAAPAGTPVLATSDAIVMQVEQDRNYGKYITLQHTSGMLSRYGHLSMQSVAPGQHVHAGETLGSVGATGRATGAHLDYRVSKDGMKFDPLLVLNMPPQVVLKAGLGSPAALAVAMHDGPVVTPGRPATTTATHPLPKSPMVIQVH